MDDFKRRYFYDQRWIVSKMVLKFFKKLLKISFFAFICSFLFLGLFQDAYDKDSKLKKSYNNKDLMIKVNTQTLTNFRINGSHGRIWPSSSYLETKDRILNQLKYHGKVNTTKTILLLGTDNRHNEDPQKQFGKDNCNTPQCRISTDIEDKQLADVVVFYKTVSLSAARRPTHQIWVLYNLEAPFNYGFLPGNNVINWTATYRRDSVLVTPYEKFVHFPNYTGTLRERSQKNYAAGKSKKVAWFASNCQSSNGRENYTRELAKYIDVDTYGDCGHHVCYRDHKERCFSMLKRQYKFYLAFENSNCKDYITEKFFNNALGNNVIPIVMGAHPDDYAAVAPPHSYIHVDNFQSPKDLANYLHKLDQDDDMYNSYFRWKGTGEFINTKFLCRVCGLAHLAAETGHRMAYTHIKQWWRGPGVCLDQREKGGWMSWNTKSKWQDKMLVDGVEVYK